MRIRHPLVLASVCLGYFMAVLDSTVVNVALPDMARSLGTGIAGMQWVVDGYALFFASLLLTAGALGDRLGNRGMFVAGLALFTLASALCGIAPSLGALVAFRALQGVGAAVQVPWSAASSRTPGPGAACFSSTCRWACWALCSPCATSRPCHHTRTVTSISRPRRSASRRWAVSRSG